MNAYSLYHRFGLWYIEGLIENCNHTFLNYDRYNDSLTYSNKKGDSGIEIASIKRLVSAMKTIRLCGTLEKAEYIYEQNERNQVIRYDLFDAIEEYKQCIAFKSV